MPRLRRKRKSRKALQTKNTADNKTEEKQIEETDVNENESNFSSEELPVSQDILNCTKPEETLNSQHLDEASLKLTPKTPVYKGAIDVKEPLHDDSVYDFNTEENSESSNSNDIITESTPTTLQENLNETLINIIKNNNEKDTNCSICGQRFDNPLDLLRHRRDLHNFPRTIVSAGVIERYFDSPNRSFCPICRKPIKTRNYRSVFIKHLMVHTVGETFECKVCSKKFKRKDHMKAHEKRHIVLV